MLCPPPSIPPALLYNIEVPWGRRKIRGLCRERESDELSENLVGSAYLANLFLILESGINITLCLLIYGFFFQGLRSYYRLKRLKFYFISLHILRG